MRVLVTGGAGFIGRWIVKRLLENNNEVWVLDNLSTGKKENLKEFEKTPDLHLEIGDIQDRKLLKKLFENGFDVCIHAAAATDIQESIELPEKYFDTNVAGTLYLLEEARKHGTRIVLVGTCMVYDIATNSKKIDETHPLNPASPYPASKLAGEFLAQSYGVAYGLPVVIVRPFNTYGPFQKTDDAEGGVVSIFIKSKLNNEPLEVYGDGTQTRDLMYVEDCADFIIKSAASDSAVGEVINAGMGIDISINELALLIVGDEERITRVPHRHPQSEINKLVCDCSKAKRLLGWKPKTRLEEGIAKTEEWLRNSRRTGK